MWQIETSANPSMFYFVILESEALMGEANRESILIIFQNINLANPQRSVRS